MGTVTFIDKPQTEQDIEIARLREEVARLHERLEENHYYEFDADGKVVRVECEPGSHPDGITCRDETIKLQDEINDRLRVEVARLRAVIGYTQNRFLHNDTFGAAVLIRNADERLPEARHQDLKSKMSAQEQAELAREVDDGVPF
jgi:hypothetical protein